MDMFEQIKASTPRRTLSATEEADLIRRARRQDRDATLQLIANYIPLMRKLIGHEARYRTSSGQFDGRVDTLESAAVAGFYDAIDRWRDGTHDRLITIQICVATALREDRASRLPVTVPQSQVGRFSRALAAADGDVTKARAIAIEFGMTSDTFSAVGDVFSATAHSRRTSATADGATDDTDIFEAQSGPTNGIGGHAGSADLDGATSVTGRPAQVRIEDLQDAARALAALDAETRMIIETLFGIGDSPALSEREASAALGIPRTTLQRKAARALDVMRATLGA